MRKKYLYIAETCEYLLICIILVLPPITLAQQNTVNLNIDYTPYSVFFRTIVVIYLSFRIHDNAYTANLHQKPTISYTNIPKSVLISIQSIGLLFLLIGISIVFNLVFDDPTTPIRVSPPHTIALWLWFIFGTIAFACFEEILFRRYLPDQARYFFHIANVRPTQHIEKVIIILIETLVIILFALAHRYMGFIAVCTALFSALALRLSVYKFSSIIPACIAHSLNNILAFILLFYA